MVNYIVQNRQIEKNTIEKMNILGFCFYKCCKGIFNSSLALIASVVEAKELKND